MSQSATQTTASQPAQSLLPDSTHLFTTLNLALIAILAVLVVLGLIYGSRLRHRRHKAVDELEEHNEALRDEGVEEVPAASTDEPLAVPAPAPPPPPVPATREAAALAPEAVDPEPVDPAAIEAAAVDEAPVAPTASPLAENPAPIMAPPAPTVPPPADGPVTQLKGLGPRVAERLADHGIRTVGDLAALTDDQAADLDAHLGPFTGRMTRDRWLEQARFLAAGDRAGFEAVFGRL